MVKKTLSASAFYHHIPVFMRYFNEFSVLMMKTKVSHSGKHAPQMQILKHIQKVTK